MDVVLLFNGLGNQMSQYAFYLAKKKHFRNTKWMYWPDRNISQHNGYELYDVFNIPIQNDGRSLLGQIYKYSSIKSRNKVLRKFQSLLKRIFQIGFVREKSTYVFDEGLICRNSPSGIRYFYGGWHSEKYFAWMRDEILQVFTFEYGRLNDFSRTVLEKIRSCNSVSIHVRRGDYVFDDYLGDVCDQAYYSKAIDVMEKKTNDPIYFVFSDDIEWAKDNLPMKNLCYVGNNVGKDSWMDMYLISQCQNNINANSTFSWWGAWLNQNSDKIVITPSHFLKGLETPDFFPLSWIQI